jgi:hypothetical protein
VDETGKPIGAIAVGINLVQLELFPKADVVIDGVRAQFSSPQFVQVKSALS